MIMTRLIFIYLFIPGHLFQVEQTDKAKHLGFFSCCWRTMLTFNIFSSPRTKKLLLYKKWFKSFFFLRKKIIVIMKSEKLKVKFEMITKSNNKKTKNDSIRFDKIIFDTDQRLVRWMDEWMDEWMKRWMD